jgi:hypothetical protein
MPVAASYAQITTRRRLCDAPEEFNADDQDDVEDA